MARKTQGPTLQGIRSTTSEKLTVLLVPTVLDPTAELAELEDPGDDLQDRDEGEDGGHGSRDYEQLHDGLASAGRLVDSTEVHADLNEACDLE